jgi:hypothetical protein
MQTDMCPDRSRNHDHSVQEIQEPYTPQITRQLRQARFNFATLSITLLYEY